MRKLIRIQTVLLSILIIALVIACAEGYHVTNTKLSDLVFNVSLDEWETIDYSSTTINLTRSTDTIDIYSQVIPAISDDGVEYELWISSSINEPSYISTTFESYTNARTRTTLTTSVASKYFRAYAYLNGDGVADQLLIGANTDTNVFFINSDGSWLPKTAELGAYEWPSPTQVINFYGIIPSSYLMDTENRTLSFSQPNADAKQHTDLLVAASKPLNRLKDASSLDAYGNEHNNPIQLNFKHALTAVTFRAEADLPSMTISEIRLKGFCNSGTYTLPMGEGNGTWAPDAETQDYYVVPSKTSTTYGSNAGILNSDGVGGTFLMIPQSMSTSKKMVMTVTEGSTTRYITASMANARAWTPGTHITYTLRKKSNSGYYLYTDQYRNDGSHWQDTDARTTTTRYFRVTSFRLDKNSSRRVKQPWKIIDWSCQAATLGSNEEITEWAGEIPTSNTTTMNNGHPEQTITISGRSGNANGYVNQNGVYGEGCITDNGIQTANSSNYDFAVTKLKSGQYYSGDKLVYGDSILNNVYSQTIDLSTYDCISGESFAKTTANCYIVNGIGTFRFPVVYGNGYKNGSVNLSAFATLKPNGSADTYLYKDYSGASIQSPDISVPSGYSAKILWIDQEIYKGVTNVNLSNGYIYFTTQGFSTGWTDDTQTRIFPGNIVIGLVNSSNQVIWQWHINITCDSQENRDLGRIRFGYNSSYGGGNFHLKFQQTSALNGAPSTYIGDTRILYFRYYGNAFWGHNNKFRSLNYNWGYPRPLPALEQGYDQVYYTTKPYYPCSGTANTTQLLTPTNFSYLTESQNTGTNTWREEAKSIFDPCPRGYRLARHSEIQGLRVGKDEPYVFGWTCTDGHTIHTLSIPEDQDKGYYLYDYSTSGPYYYYYYINNIKTIHMDNTSSRPKGMIHPVKE